MAGVDKVSVYMDGRLYYLSPGTVDFEDVIRVTKARNVRAVEVVYGNLRATLTLGKNIVLQNDMRFTTR